MAVTWNSASLRPQHYITAMAGGGEDGLVSFACACGWAAFDIWESQKIWDRHRNGE
jgi:hypothetical protein